jgi:hypothetical protein
MVLRVAFKANDIFGTQQGDAAVSEQEQTSVGFGKNAMDHILVQPLIHGQQPNFSVWTDQAEAAPVMPKPGDAIVPEVDLAHLSHGELALAREPPGDGSAYVEDRDSVARANP